jgi:hypothetical protein
MKLWSWHTTDFSLTSGHVDHCRSKYYRKVPEIPSAYVQLFRLVGTCQIIWCYGGRNGYQQLEGDTRVVWELDVPDDRVLAIIDNWVWERIIDSNVCPPDLREQWEYEAVQGNHDLDAYVEAKKHEYLSKPAPQGSWWTALFIQAINDDATVLLKHPIPDSWVLRSGEGAESVRNHRAGHIRK